MFPESDTRSGPSAWFESGVVCHNSHTWPAQTAPVTHFPPVFFFVSFLLYFLLLSAFPVRAGSEQRPITSHRQLQPAACIGMVRGVIWRLMSQSGAVQGCPGLSAARSAATVFDDSVSVTVGGLFDTRTGRFECLHLWAGRKKCGPASERRRVGDLVVHRAESEAHSHAIDWQQVFGRSCGRKSGPG